MERELHPPVSGVDTVSIVGLIGAVGVEETSTP